jgi:hypothetical protein
MTSNEFVGLLERCASVVCTVSNKHEATHTLFIRLLKRVQIASPVLTRSKGDYLIKSPTFENISTPSVERDLGECMLWFDSLAIMLRDLHYQRLQIICLSTFAFLWIFAIFAHLYHQPVLMLGGFLAFIPAWLAFKDARNIQMEFLSVRTIAEMLRIQFYLSSAGIDFVPKDRIHRRYQHVMLEVQIGVNLAIAHSSRTNERHHLTEDTIREQWFQTQSDWFEMKQGDLKGSSFVWKKFSSIAFTAGLVLIAATIPAIWYFGDEHIVVKSLITAGPMLLSAAAVGEFYRERHGFEHIAERYEQSIKIYEPDPGEWKKQLLDVGEQALQEVVDWYVTSIEREICVPKGG